MDFKDLVLKRVLYYMQSFVITAGGESFEIPRSMIANIDISKDYDLTLYPMWYVSVNVPLWFYSKMTKNPDDISVSMNLQYTMATTNEKLISPSNPMVSDVVGNFKAIIPYTEQIGDHRIEKMIEKDAGAYNTNYTYNEYSLVELSLYNTAAYKASFNKINAVLSSSNLTNAVTYCFNKCGIGNILISKADNNTTYSEFKILPHTGIANLLRIVEDYKFHEPGSTLFFDLTESYLVTHKLGCHAWKNNEYKTNHIISISEFSEAMGNSRGVHIDHEEKCTIFAVDKDSFTSQNVGTSKMLKDVGENEIFTIVTKDAMLGTLTPNKEYIVNIDSPDNKKYNGKYRLYSVSVNMVPSGEFLEPTFTVSLRR